jgi:hypothetical protein
METVDGHEAEFWSPALGAPHIGRRHGYGQDGDGALALELLPEAAEEAAHKRPRSREPTTIRS